MALSDELKNKAHDAIKDPSMREEINKIARDKGISFNQAMQEYFKKDNFDLAA